VARPGRPLRHLVFSGLPGVLRRGDLLVVNDSDTEPAAVDGHRADGRAVVLHVSGPTRHGGEWVVELRTPDGRRVGEGEAGEAVPETTAAAVNATRATGGRVVAVGTTVARALETVADPDGSVHVGAGWTDLVLGPDRPARAVDGLVTGWHEPEASHLLLLEAV